MRELAYIQTIKSLSPIPCADAIECATVLGWEIVVKKSQFNVGDKIVFCEIDSILPEYPCFEFLRNKKFRIKTCRLRGCTSQGIVFPLSVINEVDPTFDVSKAKVGDDVTEALKIVKYDSEAELDVEPEAQAKKSWLSNKYSYYKWKLFGFKKVKAVDGFPQDVPKTDETRVQKMASLLEDRVGQPVYITEKVEGTSATFIFRKNGNWLAKLFDQDGIFQVCSRNRILYNSQKGNKPPHHLMTVAEKYNIHQQLKKLNRNLAIQGECIGPKIQANPYRIPDYELKVFLIYDIDKQTYLPYDEMVTLIEELGLTMVPIVSNTTIVFNDIKYYVGLSKGQSLINGKILREGIVIRGKYDNFSFKSINPDYLLKQE
ncbi:MAG TPA: RNA ligase family protein [Candidatus Saccharimonadales bacterium]